MQPSLQHTQTLLTTVPSVTAVPGTNVIPNVITSRSDTNTPIQIESQENITEVLHNIFIYNKFQCI